MIELKLKDLSQTSQNVADAVKAAFNIDVEIVDDRLIRIAATGNARKKLGSGMKYGTTTRHVIQAAKPVVIDHIESSQYCVNCPGFKRCTYTGGIVSPIIVNGTAIGTINMVAYTEEDLQRIIKNKKGMLKFLFHMGELLSSKIVEKELSNHNRVKNLELQTVMNGISHGIVSIDISGNILEVNQATLELLDLDIKLMHQMNIKQIFEDFPLDKVKNGIPLNGIELNSSKNTYIFEAQPIFLKKDVVGTVLSFDYYSNLTKKVTKITNGGNQVTFHDIITNNATMLKLKRFARMICQNDSTVLLLGETGTGKDLFARAIHSSSSRRSNPFISINCGAIPENLIESELFGYVKGAFTGADSRGKPGKFELADQGTIFLDEISTMPLHLQKKMLKVLENNEVDKVGGKYPVKVNVRVIAASNEDLEKLVKEKRFRQDLYYRINVIPLELPPLRNRTDDLGLLAHYFIKKYNGRLNRNIKKLSNKTLGVFANYQWPGNVRELQNVIEFALNICSEDEEILSLHHLPSNINPNLEQTPSKNTIYAERDAILYRLNTKENFTEEYERKKIFELLKILGSSTEAKKIIAEKMGFSLATLYRKLKKSSYNDFS